MTQTYASSKWFSDGERYTAARTCGIAEQVWKLKARTGTGWVRQVLDDRPIVTAEDDAAYEWSDRAEAARVANVVNTRRFVQWKPVASAPTGGPRRFVP